MSRRRTHEEAVRSRLITIRVTEDQYAKLKTQTATNGMTVSGLAERLVTKGRVVLQGHDPKSLDPVVVSELKRIGNNLNQIAHAVNSNLPPAIPFAAAQMHDLVVLLTRHHYFVERGEAARTMEIANDSSPPQARDEFQRNAQLRSP